MAYDIPSADDLKAAFPAFAAVEDSVIEFWIVRAGRMVDQSWTEADFTFAQMLLAAHYMTENGLGTGAAAQAAAAGASDFKVMRSGSLTLERFDSASGASASGFATTSYGRQFAELLARNKGGPRVAPTGTVPAYPLRRSLLDGIA